MGLTKNESPGKTAEELSAAALNAICASLFELELMSAMTAEDERLTEHLAQAKASLRFALSQLRLAHDPEAGPLGYGFVMGSGQSKP